MMEMSAERRSEFRFPVVLPVEYFPPGDSGIPSYCLDLGKKGTFISSDEPLGIGSGLGIHISVPVDCESYRISRTEGTVIWNKIRPFKSKRNGMGVELIEPLPEGLLLSALAYNVKKLSKEAELKEVLTQAVEKLKSELEETKRLATLGRYVEKIIFDLSNPILALSGHLEIIRTKMHTHKRMLGEQEEAEGREFKGIIADFDDCCKDIDQVLDDYKAVSELSNIAHEDRQSLQKKLQERYEY
jgi:signal transduction histidine kinase